MASFRTEVPHGLGKEQATQRLKAFLERVSQVYQEHVTHLESSWDAQTLRFSFTTYGLNISGTLIVEDDRARVEGKLPLAALAFKGKIEKSIASELERALGS